MSPSRSIATPGAHAARLPLVGFLARVLLLASAALHPAVGSAAPQALQAAGSPTIAAVCPCGIDCAR